MRAVVLVTGDEVLEGRVGDRNGRFLAGELYAAGVEMQRVEFVGDRGGDIEVAARRALADGAHLVVTTGGLGPTHDDLTMQAVGDATGRPLELHGPTADVVRARSATYGRWGAIAAHVRDASVAKQASIPRDATPIPPTGTAPGAVVPAGDGRLVVVLPGPPSECVPGWRWAASHPPLDALLARAGGGGGRVVRVAGLLESELTEYLGTLPAGLFEGLRMGICARAGEVEVTLRQAGGAGRVDALADALAARYRDDLVSLDGRDTDAVVADELGRRGWTLAVAESCTGGMLGARITARAGSSAYFRGGVIAYANEVKEGLLRVPRDVLARHGAVSAECAAAMADGVRRALETDVGVSVTGVAGPGGGTDDKPVGTVFVGVSGPAGTETTRLRLRGEREAVRERSVGHAMHALRRAVAAPAG